jgi:ribosomal protein S18 acetylase RimI-like enzyme
VVTLRTHREDDIAVLVELARRAWRDVEASIDAVLGQPLDRLVTPSWARHHDVVVREACASPETTVVVAEAEAGHLVGFVSFAIHPPSDGMSAYGEIGALAVDPDARSRGVGRQLLDHAVDRLGAGGAPVIMVETGGDEGHAPARRLYESAGFRRLPTAQYWLAPPPAH